MCRKYMFDEDTGELIKRGDTPAKRRGGVACESTLGCIKGHWENRPDLNASEALIVELYRTSKVLGAQALTEAEQQEPLIGTIFSSLVEVDQIVERKQKEEQMATLIMIAARSSNG